jgi:hypothetical protein
MVTSTGIFLGFVLNFAIGWETHTALNPLFRNIITGTGLILCIIILIIVLYRVLNINYPKHDEQVYYTRTLQLFIVGISIPFMAILIITVEKLFH